MKLFNNNIVPYASAEGDKIYPIVVDIKKGIKSGEAISFVTADNQVGVITVDFIDGNSSYSIEGCMVTSTICRPDGTVLEIPCDIISQSTIEIPLGINGTYQEGVHTFDLKIVRGNGKVIGVPTMSYSVSGSLSSDGVVEGDDRLPVLTMVLDNAQDKLTRLDKAIAGATNDLEVKEARDGEVTLNARLERDLEKGKIHFVDVEGSNISTESEEGYLENVEILGNTWQDSENLADIRSVGTKVEGQELYEIPVLSCGKNLFNSELEYGFISDSDGSDGTYTDNCIRTINYIKVKSNTMYSINYAGGAMDKIYFYDKFKKFISLQTIYGNGKIITTPSNCEYIRLRFYYGSGILMEEIVDVQLEEGTQATPYEPYQEDKLTILSPTPLEKVGDVADRIICKDGVWGVEKNIKTVVFDGTIVNGNVSSNFPSDNSRMFYILFTDVAKSSPVICDKFPNKDISNTSNRNVEGVFVSISGSNNAFYFRIFNDKLSTQNIAGFKQWLSENNVTIKYKTVNPTFIPLPHDQQIKLRTFADRTYIHFGTEIEPTLKASVPKSLGATVNTHTSQIDSINKELDRVKKLEESTVSTVTSDKAFTTVSETTQGYFEDVKIEGKTLINLWNGTNNGYDTENMHYCKPLTTYTIYFIASDGEGQINCQYKNLSDEPHGDFVLYRSGESTDKIVLTTVKTKVDSKNLCLYSPSSKVKFTNLLILEGDYTDKDLSYFEGLKSVGQDTDEIEILSNNQNLYSENEFLSPLLSKEIINNKEYYVLKGNNTITANNLLIDDTMFKFKENTRYTFTIKGMRLEYFHKFYVTYTDGTISNTIYENIEEAEMTFTTLENKTIKNVFTDTGGMGKSYILVNGTCMKEGTDSTFVPHQSDKKEILYYNPTTQTWEKPILREWDSIEKHSDGKYYYYKRSEEVPYAEGDETKTDCITDMTTTVKKLSTEEVYECTNLDLITYPNETNLVVNSGAIQPKLELKVLSNVSNVVKLLQEKVSVLENKFIEGLKQVLAGDMMSLAHLLYPEDFENNHEIQTLEL